MAGGFFKGVKEGIKDISDGTATQERKEKQEGKKQSLSWGCFLNAKK